MTTTVILQLICPDRPGLVSEIASWVSKNNGNIRHADHHTDDGAGLFLSRIEWDLASFRLKREAIFKEAYQLADSLKGKAQLNFSDESPKVAIFVSKQSHCLLDLLWRVRSGELQMTVPLVISNHANLSGICDDFNIPFRHIPVNPTNKLESEDIIIKTLDEYGIELIVLAKYMQILSSSFLGRFPLIINIHHSFLPAFKGAQPYHKAWKRGVKLIGATAHYVTEDLDDGPIIEQTTMQVSHRDEVQDLIRKGRDTERIALARALRMHLCRQVMVYSGRTAVFA
ncbi:MULTISPECIES: formyltetrahydrofolate deformylase [Prochlorococcus]|uniref:formyltetrahydrofolate deformylase n=1 Tax=Prochlorococcus TaxID=1218 RepID=UPI0005336EB8|nr:MULTISPECIES: formyltetrahydrofolate deformylase [Prochlorococcus]KGG13740.1 Formyltetrahydrofolate deformylase [Prochlorococcus sp. MIT 0601]